MPRFLALEWDACEARVAVARTRGSEIVVEHAFAVDLQLRDGQAPGDKEVGKRVAAALAARNLGKIETLVAVGRASIELRQLSLPPSPVEELPELVRFQALRQFTTINEDWPIDFVHVDAGESESLHVIAASISPDLVSEIQATCESAELSAKRLILRPFAAASLLHRHDKNRQPPCTLMVDLLAEEADLTVMVDNQVAMMRTVRVAAGSGQEAQQRALLGEIRRTIAAAQNQLSGHRVARVVICGDGSDQSTLKTTVEKQLNYEVELFDPFNELQVEQALKDGKPEHPGRFAPLLGMLADEATGVAHAIDFLHPRQKPAPPNRWRSTGLYVGIGVAVCATIVALLLFNVMNMDAEIADLQTESKGLDKTVVKAKKKLDDVRRVEDFLSTDYTWLDELKQLSETLPPADDVILTQLSMIIAPGGGKLSLDGYTRESSQIEDVQRALRSSGRRVIPKGGGIDPRRDEYRWQFKEEMLLLPKTEFPVSVPAEKTLAEDSTTEEPATETPAAAAESATQESNDPVPADNTPSEPQPAGQDVTSPADSPQTATKPLASKSTDGENTVGETTDGETLSEIVPTAVSGDPPLTSDPAASNAP